MASLAFTLLDAHVIGGRADEPALRDDRGTMSYAELLHESASIAGALTQIGVQRGDVVTLDVPEGRERVVAVLALLRLGVVPGEDGAHRLKGHPPVLHSPVTEVPWELLLRSGRLDPAPALAGDADGYVEVVREAYADVVETLEVGGTIPT